MRRSGRIRWLLVLLLVVAALASLPLLGYLGTQQAPDYYIQKLKQEKLHLSEAREASHEMTRKVGALAGDLQQTGQWQAIFTQDQINGWLAVDLVEKHADLLPRGVRDPRVFLTADKATVVCYYEGGWPASVYSIHVEPYIAAPNQLAVRLVGFRAGAVPVPLTTVIEELKLQALQRKIPLEWATDGGDPVAMFAIPPSEDMQKKRLVLESVELRDAAIVLSGRTEETNGEPRSRAKLRWHFDVADQPDADEKEKVQR